ncbi:MAG: hypothetical protein ACREB6_13525 [Rhodospirillales bacterium]
MSETDLDLTKEQPSPPELLTFRTKPYDPEEDRERLRGVIAIIIVGLLVGIVIFSFVTLWFKWVAVTDLKSVLELVLSPIVALVGSVTGFYYGGRSK